jgi:hypothetical protein
VMLIPRELDMVEAGKQMPLPAPKPKIPETEAKADNGKSKQEAKGDDGKAKPNAGKAEDEAKPGKKSRHQAGRSRPRS